MCINFEIFYENEQTTCVIDDNGDKSWFLDGVRQNHNRHRVDGPTIERANGDVAWYKNGKLHREDGPAITTHEGKTVYALNDRLFLGPNQWAEKVLQMHDKPYDRESIVAFLRPIIAKQTQDLI